MNINPQSQHLGQRGQRVWFVSSVSHYFLSKLLLACLAGLQGGVGGSDPGAAAEREQPRRPAGPQTDR